MTKYDKLIAEARDMAVSGDEWIERDGEVVYFSELIGDLHDALKDAIDELADAWDAGKRAEKRDWEFTFDLSTPDEDRQPWTNPYREEK